MTMLVDNSNDSEMPRAIGANICRDPNLHHGGFTLMIAHCQPQRHNCSRMTSCIGVERTTAGVCRYDEPSIPREDMQVEKLSINITRSLSE